MNTARLQPILIAGILALTANALALEDADTNANVRALSQAQVMEKPLPAGATRTTVAVVPWRPLDEKTFDPRETNWL